MALTFKKQDDLEKMLENFATLPKIPTTNDDKTKTKNDEKRH